MAMPMVTPLPVAILLADGDWAAFVMRSCSLSVDFLAVEIGARFFSRATRVPVAPTDWTWASLRSVLTTACALPTAATPTVTPI